MTSESEGRERGTKEGGYERGEEREHTKWERVAELVQTDFRYGFLAEEATWQTVVLITKVGSD